MQNVITWFDLPSLDFDRAVKFYSTILGAPVQVREFGGQTLGFFPMDPKSKGVGGDLTPPGKEHKPSKEGTRIYFSCEGRLDEALGLIEKAGGKIIEPKFNLEGAGWIAIIEDTEGNIVGLHSIA